MDWVQIYDPLGSAALSPIAAGLPIAVLLGLLVLGVSAPRSALAGLVAALAVAMCAFRMPASAALAAAGYGACFGLMPIGWIVLSAVFLYHLTVRTGQFEIVKQSVMAVSPDHRMQALLIAFSFGSFLEGAAGFGTPVAISAALLIGLGFSPLYAAALALLGNTSPVAFGSLGLPIVTLAKVSGMNEMALGQVAGQQLTLFSLIIPAWLVVVMSGWKGLKGCWPAVLVCGGSFATAQFCISQWYGPALVNIVGGAASLILTTAFLRFWKPKDIWRFPEEGTSTKETKGAKNLADDSTRNAAPLSARSVAYAWTPWIILSLMIFLWGVPSWKAFLNGGTPERPSILQGVGKPSLEVPGLHNRVYRTAPVVAVSEGTDRAAKPETAVYEFNWLSTTGTCILLSALLSALWLRVSPRMFVNEFATTLYRVRWALFTIACMLALAFTTKYSGADATLGLALRSPAPIPRATRSSAVCKKSRRNNSG